MEQNDRVICVKQVEFRQCYDSTWEITMLLGSQIMTRQIVRRDTESHLRLAKILQDIDTLEALLALDERANIYYD